MAELIEVLEKIASNIAMLSIAVSCGFAAIMLATLHK